MENKLNSLSIFFPFLNEEGNVPDMIDWAYEWGRKVTDDLEVIALHGGPSKDKTFEKILEMQKKYPDLKIVDKRDNTESYAVIKHGFRNATKEWVFYTDGDKQYHLDELPLLVEKQLQTGADLVNGYKLKRGDNFLRIFLGTSYELISRNLFKLPIKDTDCDYRLIRKSFLDKITMDATGSSILPEILKKLEFMGAKFAEVPVKHYNRTYGKSWITPMGLVKEKVLGDLKFFLKMRSIQKEIQNSTKS